MKASLLVLALAIATLQTTLTPPPAGQRAPLDAAQCKCSIEVTVKHLGGDEPIGDIDVSLFQPVTPMITADNADYIAYQMTLQPGKFGAPDNAIKAKTDNNGRAVFRDLAEGNYVVLAKHDGDFGVFNDGYETQATSRIDVVPDAVADARGATRERVQQVTLNMVPGVTISGLVFDANHRPASGIQVGAYQVAYQYGHRVLTQTGTVAQTNDRGEYRLFWFPPGEYYVRTGNTGITVGGAFTGTAPRSGGNNSQTSYYPGTTDGKLAIPIVVREGSDLTGIDIALQVATGVTVSGTIINSVPGRVGPQGQVNRITSVVLVPRNPFFWETPTSISIGGAARAARGEAPPNDSETAFELRGITPGTYDFYPAFNSAGQTTDFAARQVSTYSGRTTIEVGTSNIAGIQSAIRPGTDLKGHVTIIGNPPASTAMRAARALTLADIRIYIQPKDNIPVSARTGLNGTHAPDTNGEFDFLNLVEGQYFVNDMPGLPVDAYVSDIRQDAHSIFEDDVITIGKESQSMLEVVISRGGATIQGTVLDSKRNPIPSVRVALVPDMPRRQNLLLYKSAFSNAMGTFDLNGIAPGNYKLFAWEHIPAGAEQNAEFMRDYEEFGVSVNIARELPLANITVPIIPAKR